jgi:hypothetical protein
MTKSDNSYSSIQMSEPYVEGFSVGNSHAFTVIVDESTNSNNHTNANIRNNNRSQPNHSSFVVDGSRKPVQLSMCPECSQKHVRTKTITYPSAMTWVSVFVGVLVFFPICWIPLVLDPMKQTDHYCQSCGTKVGTVKALEGCCIREEM